MPYAMPSRAPNPQQSGGNEIDPQSFIAKAYSMISQADPSTCSWSEDGTSFIIKDQGQFTELLPHFFKHRNFRSFVRQLNFYGFRKIRNESALLPSRPNNWSEFKHDFFVKDRPELLHNIKRTGTSESAATKKSDASKVGSGVTVVGAGTGHEQERIFVLEQQVELMREQIDTLTGLVTQLVAERQSEAGYNAVNGTNGQNFKRRRVPSVQGLRPPTGPAPAQSGSGRPGVPSPPAAQHGQGRGGDDVDKGISAGHRLEGMPLNAVSRAHLPGSGSNPQQPHGAHNRHLTSFEMLRDMLGRNSAGSDAAYDALERMGSDPAALMSQLSLTEDAVTSILTNDYSIRQASLNSGNPGGGGGGGGGGGSGGGGEPQSMDYEGASAGLQQGDLVTSTTGKPLPPMVAAFALGAEIAANQSQSMVPNSYEQQSYGGSLQGSLSSLPLSYDETGSVDKLDSLATIAGAAATPMAPVADVGQQLEGQPLMKMASSTAGL